MLHNTIGPTYKMLPELTHLQWFNDVMMGQGHFILVKRSQEKALRFEVSLQNCVAKLKFIFFSRIFDF
jgi:hypothetical protein